MSMLVSALTAVLGVLVLLYSFLMSGSLESVISGWALLILAFVMRISHVLEKQEQRFIDALHEMKKASGGSSQAS